MAHTHTKLYFVKKARNNIYENGTTTKNERGYNVTNLSIPKNKRDKIVIKKGESYWWWKWRFSDRKYVSKTEPNPSALSKYGRSEWEEKLEEFENSKSALEQEPNADEKESLLTDIDEYKSDLEGRLSNMPDSLQESSVLNERIEELDSLYNEVEGLEVDED